MKKIYILLALFMNFTILDSQSYEFDAERMGVDFNGLCYNDNVVITYGTGSIVLSSIDKGENWVQNQIANDSLTIQKILSINQNFIGIIREGFLIKSIDNSKTWEIVKIINNSNLIDLEVYDNKLFILTSKNSIIIYNEDLIYQDQINLDKTVNYYNLKRFVDKLYLSSGKNSILEIDINNKFLQKSIDISNYGNYAFNFRTDSNYFYAQIDSSLFRTNQPLKNWEKLSQSINNYNIKNDSIYNLKVNYNDNWQVSWPDFFQITGNKNVKVNLDSIQRYLTSIYFTDFDFIDLKTIIAVGTNKTIFLSTNSGITWTLKSNFNMNNKGFKNINFWINKQEGFYSNSGQIFKTTNAGCTWLPQIFTDTLIKYIRYFDTFYIDSTGLGFAWSTDNYHILEDTNKNITFIYTNNFGESYQNKWQDELSPLKHGSLASQTKINVVKRRNKYYFSTVPIEGQLFKNNYTKIFEMNTNFEITNLYSLDSISIMGLFVDFKNDLLAISWERKYPNDIGGFDSSSVFIINSTDVGKTWTKIFKCETEGEYPSVSLIDDKFIYLKTQKQINITIDSAVFNSYFYLIDYKNQETKLFFIDSMQRNSSNIIFNFKNNLYLKKGNNDIIKFVNLVGTNYSEETILNFINSTINISQIYGNLYEDNNSFYTSYSKYINKNQILMNIYKMKPNGFTGVDVINDESSYFWSSPCYPNPATQYVQFQLFSNEIINIELKDIMIYNINGEMIPSNGNIDILPISKNSTQVKWEFLNIHSGIYFIYIKNNSYNTTVPVLIYK